MTRVLWAGIAAGLTLASAAGCYRYPSAPYPATYNQPGYATPQGIPPGAVRQPDGSYILPGPASPGGYAPSGGFVSPGNGPTLAPPQTGGDAPAFQGNPTYAPGGGAPAPGGGVPNYTDPNSGDFDFGPAGGGAGARPDDGFQPAGGGANSGGTGTPFYESGQVPRPMPSEFAARPLPPGAAPQPVVGARPSGTVAAAGGKDYFSGLDKFKEDGRPSVPSDLSAAAGRPVRPAGFEEDPSRPPIADYGFDPGATPPGVKSPAVKTPAAPAQGFGYDRAGYAWLQGVVDYDPQQKTWNVIYAVTPEPTDRFGGSLTLSDAGLLAEMQDNDVVRLEGRPDPAAGADALGKPLYRVKKAELVGRFE